MRPAYLAAVLLSPAVLSGCVAAAIPVLAGGMLAGKDRIGFDSPDEINAPAPKVTIDDARNSPAVDEPGEAIADPAPTPLPETMAKSAPSLITPAIVPAAPQLALLSSYVESQARRDPVSQPRQSAILAAPGSLSPDRSDCSIRPPAVVFDLDPADEAFDPSGKAKADPALVQMLHSFRMQEVEIFWVSELAALDAGKIRKRLVESGLDPVGRDGLLLMRRIDDRKQARRRELSETHCAIAIAGDRKTDFDELYEYLKDPSAAKPLDSLLGAGWFLIPSPLLDQSSSEGQ